jgi:CMP-N-acetylneuraminic acid synthetase
VSTLTALLPMKAHSERVPRKNFRPLAGKPLFRWILDTLLSVEMVGQVVINTDARYILEELGLREDARVRIRDRRPELCGDLVSMNLVLADDVANCDGDEFLMTHTTNPLLSAATITRAIQDWRKTPDADSLFSVNRIQTRFYRRDGTPVNHDPARLVRTQDLEAWYEENSCLYLFTRDSFGETQARIGKSPMMFVTPSLESVDIDEEYQWTMAAALIEARERTRA